MQAPNNGLGSREVHYFVSAINISSESQLAHQASKLRDTNHKAVGSITNKCMAYHFILEV